MEVNKASDSEADLPHEHTLNCYLLDCPHERAIHTSETNGDESTSKATGSNAVELLMDIEPYEITGDGYTFDADAEGDYDGNGGQFVSICTVAEIVAANPIIQNPDIILPGWLLEIP